MVYLFFFFLSENTIKKKTELTIKETGMFHQNQN